MEMRCNGLRHQTPTLLRSRVHIAASRDRAKFDAGGHPLRHRLLNNRQGADPPSEPARAAPDAAGRHPAWGRRCWLCDAFAIRVTVLRKPASRPRLTF